MNTPSPSGYFKYKTNTYTNPSKSPRESPLGFLPLNRKYKLEFEKHRVRSYFNSKKSTKREKSYPKFSSKNHPLKRRSSYPPGKGYLSRSRYPIFLIVFLKKLNSYIVIFSFEIY